jgi:hypothetical protein
MNTYQCIGTVNVTIRAESALDAAKQYLPLDIWHEVVEVSVYRIGRDGKWGREQYFRAPKGGHPVNLPVGDGMD